MSTSIFASIKIPVAKIIRHDKGIEANAFNNIWESNSSVMARSGFEWMGFFYHCKGQSSWQKHNAACDFMAM
jgi:hypothetical protein